MYVHRLIGSVCLAAMLTGVGRATETENINLRVLPARGPVTIDGQFGDWDLTGSRFGCSNVETLRERAAVWFAAMYDAENLYLLARWVDDSPLNNPSSTAGGYSFQGDDLEFRIITGYQTPAQRASHWNAWRGADGNPVIDYVYGLNFRGGAGRNPEGARQAFAVNPGQHGYVQEVAIPWKLLTQDGHAVKAGSDIILHLHAHLTSPPFGIHIPDLWRPGIAPNRVTPYNASDLWGLATLETAGQVPLLPVRLADGREFPVKLEGGLPVVDWTGVIKPRELKGFIPVTFTMPADGYISLNIKDANGVVVRQLLNCDYFLKGSHTVLWDGLTNPHHMIPGEAVAPGSYQWAGIWHRGLGLRFRGWACNGGSAPWDKTPTSNWGGDHGDPAAGATDGNTVFLGWSGAEAGRGIVACDTQGNVRWRAPMGVDQAFPLAVSDGTLYGCTTYGALRGLFRIDAKTGQYQPWAGRDSAGLPLDELIGAARADAASARDGKIYLAVTQSNLVAVLDGKTGALLRKMAAPAPVDLAAAAGESVHVLSGKSVLLFDAAGAATPVITGLTNPTALTVDRQGTIYVGEGEPENVVKCFSPAGKRLRTIGRPGGRPLLGKWDPLGLRFIGDLAVDDAGQLWVTERDGFPKRFSVWQTKDGAFVREFFGPSAYGALGGAINPQDPDVMFGQGCEWRLDPRTGRARCTAVVTREHSGVAQYVTGPNGRLYLFVGPKRASGTLWMFERRGEADYILRATLTNETGEKEPFTTYWADANGDAQRQADEVTGTPGWVLPCAWYLRLTPDLTLYPGGGPGSSTGKILRYRLQGFTACGAPRYDLANPESLPIPADKHVSGLGSGDGWLFVQHRGEHDGFLPNAPGNLICYDVATGAERWRYPNDYSNVGGAMRGPAMPQPGMLRGAFECLGTITLPEPVGAVWIYATNCGEWHLLTSDGYYLSRLFQGDFSKHQWPEAAVPGAVMDECPSGMGGEDFGGCVTRGADGKVYVQAGKTGYWNLEVTGLDTVQPLGQAPLATLTDRDVARAAQFRTEQLQQSAAGRVVTVKQLTPTFTGKLDTDFAGAQIVAYQKLDNASVRSVAAWDAQHLYLGWQGTDQTPWVNGAADAAEMYQGGDTVDFQLGTNPGADKKRAEATLGDLRLSIGNLKGQATAVIFRKVANPKHPRTFTSGTVKEYIMESVVVVKEARITVTVNPGKGYVVEAAIPLSALGVQPTKGLTLRGDFGATHGDTAGQRTRLRTHWSDQFSNVVDDIVWELVMHPANWGDLIFQ
jgi:hypothetical protein